MIPYIDVHGTVNFDTQNIVFNKTFFKNKLCILNNVNSLYVCPGVCLSYLHNVFICIVLLNNLILTILLLIGLKCILP